MKKKKNLVCESTPSRVVWHYDANNIHLKTYIPCISSNKLVSKFVSYSASTTTNCHTPYQGQTRMDDNSHAKGRILIFRLGGFKSPVSGLPHMGNLQRP